MTARWTVWSWETIIRFRSGGGLDTTISDSAFTIDQRPASAFEKWEGGDFCGNERFHFAEGKDKDLDQVQQTQYFLTDSHGNVVQPTDGNGLVTRVYFLNLLCSKSENKCSIGLIGK